MLNLYYINLSDNPLLEGTLNVTRAIDILISNTSISELIHKNATKLINCNLNNTALLGKVDGFTQCDRSNLFTLDSNCGSTSYLYSNSYSTLPSTSIDPMLSTASPATDDSSTIILSVHTFEISSTYRVTSTIYMTTSSLPVPLRLTRKINDQGKATFTQIDQKSTTAIVIKTTVSRQISIVSTTISNFSEPKSVDFQNIKFTFTLAIRLFINWGLIIYIITECKRSYAKRTNKNKKILSMRDV